MEDYPNTFFVRRTFKQKSFLLIFIRYYLNMFRDMVVFAVFFRDLSVYYTQDCIVSFPVNIISKDLICKQFLCRKICD